MSKYCSYTAEHAGDQKPTRTDKANGGKACNRIQDNSHVDCGTLVFHCLCVSLFADCDAIHASCVKHNSRESQVAEHPGEHDCRSEALVVVLMLLLSCDDLLRWLIPDCECAQFFFVLRIEMATSTLPPGLRFAAGSFSGLSSPFVPHVMS